MSQFEYTPGDPAPLSIEGERRYNNGFSNRGYVWLTIEECRRLQKFLTKVIAKEDKKP